MNIRLSVFDAFIGRPAGLKILAEETGWFKALQLGAELEMTLLTDNPFNEINQREKLTPEKESSQQQMVPVVVLYRLLQKKGYSKEKAIQILDKLVTEVAFRFLQYNIPLIQKGTARLPEKDKISLFKKLSSRFFNAEAKISTSGSDTIHFDVHFCHFAHYCRELNVPELGYLFCKADKIYFEKSQPNIHFSRTQTVMEGSSVCDFKFSLKE